MVQNREERIFSSVKSFLTATKFPGETSSTFTLERRNSDTKFPREAFSKFHFWLKELKPEFEATDP
jgi:hypothetical protein